MRACWALQHSDKRDCGSPTSQLVTMSEVSADGAGPSQVEELQAELEQWKAKAQASGANGDLQNEVKRWKRKAQDAECELRNLCYESTPAPRVPRVHVALHAACLSRVFRYAFFEPEAGALLKVQSALVGRCSQTLHPSVAARPKQR